MNNQQFIYWLGGVIDAVGQEGPTPEQWETIVSKLNQVAEPVSFPFGTPNIIPSGPIPRYPWNEPGIKYHPDINKVTCEGYTGIISGSIGTITTNGSTGTTANPFQYSTLTIGNTTTTLPKGVDVNYTANLPEDL